MQTSSWLRPTLSSLLLTAVTFYAVACGGSDGSVGSSSSSPAGAPRADGPGERPADEAGGGADGSASTGPTCGLPNTGAVVQGTLIGAAAPVMTGGTMVDGLYTLTSSAAYSGPGGPSAPFGAIQSSLRLSKGGTTFQLVLARDGATTVDAAGTAVAEGSTMETSYVCGRGAESPYSFTATSTSFVMAIAGPQATLVNTYTLVP